MKPNFVLAGLSIASPIFKIKHTAQIISPILRCPAFDVV